MSAFAGVFPASITPMTADGHLHEEALARVLEFNIEAGAHGFWLAGGSGESVLLDDEENQRIASIAARVCRGRAKTIHHVGAPTTARAARLAAHAASQGIDAICCVPPFFYRRSDAEIVEHYRVVAGAADLPLFVYNLPSSTGVEITPELMEKIGECVPHLAGLKHSSAHFARIATFAEMGLSCFVGSSALMLPALSLGACGCIDGPPNLDPGPWVEVWEAFGEGDLARAGAAQKQANAVIELATLFGGTSYHAVLKAVLSLRLGIECGAPRPPALPLSAEQRRQVEERVVALGLMG